MYILHMYEAKAPLLREIFGCCQLTRAHPTGGTGGTGGRADEVECETNAVWMSIPLSPSYSRQAETVRPMGDLYARVGLALFAIGRTTDILFSVHYVCRSFLGYCLANEMPELKSLLAPTPPLSPPNRAALF